MHRLLALILFFKIIIGSLNLYGKIIFPEIKMKTLMIKNEIDFKKKDPKDLLVVEKKLFEYMNKYNSEFSNANQYYADIISMEKKKEIAAQLLTQAPNQGSYEYLYLMFRAKLDRAAYDKYYENSVPDRRDFEKVTEQENFIHSQVGQSVKANINQQSQPMTESIATAQVNKIAIAENKATPVSVGVNKIENNKNKSVNNDRNGRVMITAVILAVILTLYLFFYLKSRK